MFIRVVSFNAFHNPLDKTPNSIINLQHISLLRRYKFFLHIFSSSSVLFFYAHIASTYGKPNVLKTAHRILGRCRCVCIDLNWSEEQIPVAEFFACGLSLQVFFLLQCILWNG